MVEAIIALVCTVVGAILGWVLANIKTGKLDISIGDFFEEYFYTDPESISIPDRNNYELYQASFYFTIQLHNSSAINRAIRDCSLVFYDSCKNRSFEMQVVDLSTAYTQAMSIRYKSLDVVNVEAYKSQNIKVKATTGNIEKLLKTNEVVFQYLDEKFKKHELTYKDISFGNIPQYNVPD